VQPLVAFVLPVCTAGWRRRGLSVTFLFSWPFFPPPLFVFVLVCRETSPPGLFFPSWPRPASVTNNLAPSPPCFLQQLLLTLPLFPSHLSRRGRLPMDITFRHFFSRKLSDVSFSTSAFRGWAFSRLGALAGLPPMALTEGGCPCSAPEPQEDGKLHDPPSGSRPYGYIRSPVCFFFIWLFLRALGGRPAERMSWEPSRNTSGRS